jgi:uncharacterized protein YfiM (DUF2279 family)
MEIVETLKDNWMLVAFALLLAAGMMGGPKQAWAKVKKSIASLSPIGDGAPDGKDAFDAAQLLYEFLPDDAAKKMCTLVSPYLLTDHHEDET